MGLLHMLKDSSPWLSDGYACGYPSHAVCEYVLLDVNVSILISTASDICVHTGLQSHRLVDGPVARPASFGHLGWAPLPVPRLPYHGAHLNAMKALPLSIYGEVLSHTLESLARLMSWTTPGVEHAPAA